MPSASIYFDGELSMIFDEMAVRDAPGLAMARECFANIMVMPSLYDIRHRKMPIGAQELDAQNTGGFFIMTMMIEAPYRRPAMLRMS